MTRLMPLLRALRCVGFVLLVVLSWIVYLPLGLLFGFDGLEEM